MDQCLVVVFVLLWYILISHCTYCFLSAYLCFYRSFPQSLTVEYQKQLRPVTHVSTEIVYPLCLPPPSLILSLTSTSFPVDNKYHVAMPSRDILGQYSQTHTHGHIQIAFNSVGLDTPTVEATVMGHYECY